MSNSLRPIVHIGMAKAASTFLQLELVPNLPGYANLGKHCVADELKKASMALTRLTSIDWPRVGPHTTTVFKTALEGAKEKGLRPVYSEEDLSVYKFLDPEMMARRLREILGPYDVLFIIRNPFTWIPSNYLFRLQNLNPIAVLGFEKWFQHHAGTQSIGSDIGEIWFSALMSTYASHSEGKLHILPYEIMKKNPQIFCDKLSSILDVDSSHIRKLMAATRDRRAHKVRITELQRQLFETFRWIELEQPKRFRGEVLNLCENKLTKFEKNELNELVSDSTTKRETYRKFIFNISSTLSDDCAIARVTLSDENRKFVNRVTKNSLEQLEKEFEFSLSEFGISYIE